MNNLKISNIIFIIIIILLFIIIYNLYNKNEYFDNAYNTIVNKYYDTNGYITMNNLNVTGNLNFGSLKGVIVAWSGLITNIPSGWGLCDGTIYTALDGSQLQSPDLRSKFIVGASKTETVYQQITEKNVQLSFIVNSETIPLTPKKVGESGGEIMHTLLLDELPKHTHSVKYMTGGNGYIEPTNEQVGPPTPAETSSYGGGQAHNNMPPYYSLLYIIKL